MILLVLISFLLTYISLYLGLFKGTEQAVRRTAIASFIFLSLFIAVSTEILGAFNLITAYAIKTVWLALSAGLYFRLYRNGYGKPHLWSHVAQESLHNARIFIKKLGLTTQIALSCILLITCLIAIVATPNNLDSLSYHLSRVGYWVQNKNVAHYASHIERALSFSPFSEYVHLHTYLLAGSERYFQLLQWLSLIGILLSVSILVEKFSASAKALRITILFAASIPIVVLESMTTQNDLVVTFFILVTVIGIFDYTKNRMVFPPVILVTAIALGIMTKGYYLFYVFPYGAYFLFYLVKNVAWQQIGRLAMAVVLLTLLLNAPFWLRNYQIFQTPLGSITSGNQVGIHTPAGISSSVLKHVFLHLGFVSPGDQYNAFMLEKLERVHNLIGISLHEPELGMPFKMNRLNFNEDFAHNFLAMWLILAALILFFIKKSTPLQKRYLALTILSFVTFCSFISYQWFGSRIHIPFFILMAPCIGFIYGSFNGFIQTILLLLLWINALPYALLSATRPLLSTRWFFETVFPIVNKPIGMNIDVNKQENLLQQSVLFNSPRGIIWGIQEDEIRFLTQKIDSIKADRIGFIFHESSYDYGYQYSLRRPGRTFRHVSVLNPSTTLEDKTYHPDCILTECDNGDRFTYNGIIYSKKWSVRFRCIYQPTTL